jgi:hypothetical protein
MAESDDTKTREAVERVRARIKESQRDKEDGDEASWGYETGILLTRNEAKALLAALDRVTAERDAEYHVRKCVLWALEGQGLPKELPEHGYGVIEMAHRMRSERDAATTAERERIRRIVARMGKNEQWGDSVTVLKSQTYNAALADVTRALDTNTEGT